MCLVSIVVGPERSWLTPNFSQSGKSWQDEDCQLRAREVDASKILTNDRVGLSTSAILLSFFMIMNRILDRRRRL